MGERAGEREGAARVRVWDGPLRLFHWSLPVLIAFSWWCAESGNLEWHRWSGYTILTLVLFRLVWGFVGSDTARFSQFVRGFRSIGAHLRGAAGPTLGHNPLGALSVVAMLALLLAQTMLGLFAVDIDGIESGPLAVFVSFEQGRIAAEAHHLVFNTLLVLIALHLLAIAFYALVKRENLVGPMITGARRFEGPAGQPPRMAPLWRAILVAALAAGLVYAVAHAFWLF